MNKTITIGPGTDIDLASLIESRLLIQGNSGSGKSGVARGIIEKTFGKVPFVVWDIEGEYYTLKELSGDIIVIGGQHADVPVTMELAEKLPAFIIKNGLSVVVDLSDLKMHGRIEFTKDFFETLMDLPMQYWTSYFFFLEECHKLAGEQDKQESATAIKDLMQRGRKRGYCGVPITQRISMLNKSVAAECNNKFIGRTSLDNDIDRSAKELGFGKKDDKNSLRDLKRGEFYAYGPSITPDYVHKIIVDKPKTTMIKAGINKDFVAKKPTAKLLDMLAKLSEKPKADPHPTEKRQFQDANEVAAVRIANRDLNDRVIKLQNELYESEGVATGYSKMAVLRGVAIEKIKTTLQEVLSEITDLSENEKLPIPDKSDNDNHITHTSKTERLSEGSAVTSGGGAHVQALGKIKWDDSKEKGSLTGGERVILIACAPYTEGLDRRQLTLFTGYKQSARDTFISRLKQRGYLQQQGERLVATLDGKITLGTDYQPLPTGRKLREYWVSRLTGGEKNIFLVLVENYPKTITREDLTIVTKYKQSARDTFISRLLGRELITLPAKGLVQASKLLFT